MLPLPVQFMGDIVKPASKDAGGQIEGTVSDLKEQVCACAAPSLTQRWLQCSSSTLFLEPFLHGHSVVQSVEAPLAARCRFWKLSLQSP